MSQNSKAVYLCAPKRTAIGSFNGSLASVPATRLGAVVIESVVNESNAPKESIEQVIFGCALSAGLGQAPARQAALGAGLSQAVQALTINKVCSSGLKAVMLAADTILAGHAQVVIAGGMESMSRAPYLLPSLRSGARLGHATAEDSILRDGLWDVYNDFHMGAAAELCALEYKLSREMQDDFARESYTRAMQAISSGYFASEICPVEVSSGKETISFSVDEEPARGKLEKFSSLKPVFDAQGTVTAANASSINDGAAAMLVCTEDYLKIHKLTPIGRIVAQGWNAQAPEWFTTAPVGALRSALDKAGKKVKDIDLFEINEAFSAVALACLRDLEIPQERLNVHGGAVALGHPIGASGARILTSLLYSLKRYNGALGAVAICNGGGEATAMVVESV